MDEREKMARGLLYDANHNPDLIKERAACKDMCFAYNSLRPSDEEGKRKIAERLFGRIGRAFSVLAPFYCDYGKNIEVGKNFFANYNCMIIDVAKVTIGENCMMAPNVAIYTAGHPIHPAARNSAYEYGIEVTIGDNVWLGGNTVVVPGVHIGSNVVIGAGSVVTKDIPDWSVAVGNPCRVVKKITEEDKQYYFKDRKFDDEAWEVIKDL